MSEERLTGNTLRQLKSMGQRLDPVVRIGKSGLSAALVASVDQALGDHELIKVKFEALKEQKQELVRSLATATRSHVVQRVGHVVVLYRQHPDPEKRKVQVKAQG